MLLGAREDFAIECFHEPNFPNERGWVFGRMCVWCRGIELGDLSEPDCMLNVTEGHIQDCLALLDDLHDETVDDLSDNAAFRFLNAALYLDDGRTTEQISADSQRYSKFNFLTNSGESFDGIKAFLLKGKINFRILYRLSSDMEGCAEVTRESLVGAMLGFLDWITIEKQTAPADISITTPERGERGA